MSAIDKVILAIDLGTTYCCTAVFKNGHEIVIPIIEEDGNYDENKLDNEMPSYVTFNEDEIIIGRKSKMNFNVYMGNTVYDTKRIIGKPYNDKELQEDKRFWSYKIVNNSGKPYIQIDYEEELKEFSPEEISALLLKKLKKNAENYLGQEITDAVITVPVHFNNEQRKATKKAGELAGLNVLRIINEPNAAVMAYGLEREVDESPKIVLVFDLGGGTFDLSILKINKSLFEVLSTGGDNHLGGIDFDNRLTCYLLKEFASMYKNEIKIDDITNGVKRRIKAKSEHIKELLSIKNEVNAIINSLYDGKDLNITITRSEFEKLNEDIFKRIIKLMEETLKKANLKKDEIDEVVMVGGSTNIPKIQEIVQEFFNGKKINKSINPNKAVASGAAIFASTLSENKSEKTQDLVLKDVTPFTLGIKTAYGTVEPIIKCNTPIPARGVKSFTTYWDQQTTALIPIYEGERLFAKDNNLLGKFYLSDIPQVPKGKLKINIIMDVDENGILNVSATETETGKCNKITITNKS
ncbi:heat shock protein 70 [Neocallimastix californiae]|uniref:Heat shock protein 70 n=1 Tax=Neocallimastix californiae TaxID=1754190 RepID=A0A1Y2CJG5_9FUNG|nr:heat shock protein 70 [Neocallimastix californiae]|eukprot:ORY47158.1 heat shock protein 70 [Neocallimastix californiae]